MEHSLLLYTSIGISLFIGICYLYQTLYLFLPYILPKRKYLYTAENAPLHRYAVCIAARNEEAVLPELIKSIQSQNYPASHLDIYVIADNCTDHTASAAENAGAVVFERQNREQVGKGYALAYLFEAMKCSGVYEKYDAFLILDADNLLDVDYMRHMNRLFAEGFDALTSRRNTKNFGDNWLTSGYGLWFLHEGIHLNHSRMRLGAGCAVSGTGFMFSRRLLDDLGGWHYHTLTEDIEFSTECAIQGRRIGYCHEAVFYDEQPTRFGVSIRQRTRWIQGGIQVAFQYGARVLGGMFTHKSLRKKYTCFENLTLSMWGYCASAAAFFFQLFAIFMVREKTVLMALGASCVGFLLSLFTLGVLTTVFQWNEIHAGTGRRIAGMFTFPFFMITFLIPVFAAVLTRPVWHPIPHTRVITAKEIQ